MPYSFTNSSTSLKSSPHSYYPVPAADEETLLASPEEAKEAHVLPSRRTLLLDPTFWLTAFAVLSVAFTVRDLLVIRSYSQEPHDTYMEASIVSPYNGLEKLVRNESSPLWPLSSTHYPDFIGATEGPHIHHALNNGSIVRLDSRRTVILQHRVRDYGLEHCSVTLELSHPTEDEHGHNTRGYGHIGESPYLSLWRLEETGSQVAALAPSILPASLPARTEWLGDIILDGTRTVSSPSFGCRVGSVQILEIAVSCASDPCIMEFRLTQSPRQGFWVAQSEQESVPI